MRKRAFSLVEIIVVIAIISVVAAIVSPVLWRVKHSVDMTASASKLRQLGVAIHIYQADYDLYGASVYALPSYSYIYTEFMGFGKEFFVSPCGYKDDIEQNKMRLSYQYWGGDPYSEPSFEKHGDNSALFSDLHCNDNGDQFRSLYRSKRGIAVLYSGQVVNRFKPGDTGTMDWWSIP